MNRTLFLTIACSLSLASFAHADTVLDVVAWKGNEAEIDPSKLFPAAVLGSLPQLILFAFFQRRIMSGATAGAVK